MSHESSARVHEHANEDGHDSERQNIDVEQDMAHEERGHDTGDDHQ